jgi:hypothetical protein
VIITVTVNAGALNHSWHRPSPALLADLPADPPPSWVPATPDWFEEVVAQMLAAVTA